jgi:hypothetical protein
MPHLRSVGIEDMIYESEANIHRRTERMFRQLMAAVRPAAA